jgi:hypothetical protein
VLEPAPVALELERPPEQLEAERRRLGVHAVRAADGHGVAVLFGTYDDRVRRASEAATHKRSGALQRECEGRVENVGGRETEVEPAPLRTEPGRDRVDESGHIVVRRALELGDALRGRDSRALADRPGGRGGERADLRPRVDDGELHVEPALEPCRVGPDPRHLGSGVARDHRRDSRRGTCAHSSATNCVEAVDELRGLPR